MKNIKDKRIQIFIPFFYFQISSTIFMVFVVLSGNELGIGDCQHH